MILVFCIVVVGVMDFRLHNNVDFILVNVGFILLLRQIASCLSLPIGRAFIPKNVYSQQILKGVELIRLRSGSCADLA